MQLGASTYGPPIAAGWRRKNVARVDLVIARNVAFTQGFRLTNGGAAYDLTNVEAEAQVRAAGRRRGNLLVDFEEIIGGVTKTDDDGRIVLYAPLSVTSALPLVPAEWDLILTPLGGQPFPVLAGTVTIVAGATVHD